MKTLKMISLIALFCVAALFLPSCQDEDDVIFYVPENTDTVSGIGGTIKALNGNVILSFPEGAVDEAITFTVNVCPDTEECEYAIKMIKIEPLVKFNAPVTLSLKYDGELFNNVQICEGMCLQAYFWNDEQDFYNHTLVSQCLCGVNYVDHTINFCICQSGIFAVGQKTVE